jgi:hypothetical protein
MVPIKKWLMPDYPDVVRIINRAEGQWKASGSRERRNWWEVLAGGIDGNPITVGGLQFPVLRAAQIRQGKAITANALCRNEDEIPPVPRKSREEPKRQPIKLPKTAKAVKVKGKQKRSSTAVSR